MFRVVAKRVRVSKCLTSGANGEMESVVFQKTLSSDQMVQTVSAFFFLPCFRLFAEGLFGFWTKSLEQDAKKAVEGYNLVQLKNHTVTEERFQISGG